MCSMSIYINYDDNDDSTMVNDYLPLSCHVTQHTIYTLSINVFRQQKQTKHSEKQQRKLFFVNQFPTF